MIDNEVVHLKISSGFNAVYKYYHLPVNRLTVVGRDLIFSDSISPVRKLRAN
jgi:hypothetical protein